MIYIIDMTNTKDLCFIDTEVNKNKTIGDFGAYKVDKTYIHTKVSFSFLAFISDSKYLVGHNIIHFDKIYLKPLLKNLSLSFKYIDTLLLSPLLFPKKPYHKLLKDDKLMTSQANNPLLDCQKCADLFFDELTAYEKLDADLKNIYFNLLSETEEFHDFFDFIEQDYMSKDTERLIRSRFDSLICKNAALDNFIKYRPIELAYALALISANDKESMLSSFVRREYPYAETIIKKLKNTPCHHCKYCDKAFDIKDALSRYFHYDNFRKFDSLNLQEIAVQAAIDKKSFIAVFPTSGGKSLTFQLPAFIDFGNEQSLTVVISPLVSLMSDQIDNLKAKGILGAVTLNSNISPIEKQLAYDMLKDGRASLLYISPEQLRSTRIKKILTSRSISRFVIDEAHCFSSWGQNFRTDYQYIATFIKNLQEEKNNGIEIPISCFTATAKRQVVDDIKSYFKEKLNREMDEFIASPDRKNLTYSVIKVRDDVEKYSRLRELLESSNKPAIVFVNTTKGAENLAEKLSKDGLKSIYYHGKMKSEDKAINQDLFMQNSGYRIMVATSAFGMGVDKSDIELVIHYNIPSSLENYMQEAGRAGRDPNINSRCYILYNSSDIDEQFNMLNQSKVSLQDIQRVYQTIKALTIKAKDDELTLSTLELAKKSGYPENTYDLDTKMKTIINSLEQSNYIERLDNVPKIYLSSINVLDMQSAADKINAYQGFSSEEKKQAKDIMSFLINERLTIEGSSSYVESRIDYISDLLGIGKHDMIKIIIVLKSLKLIDIQNDMVITITSGNFFKKAIAKIDDLERLEKFIVDKVSENNIEINLKEINDQAISCGINTSIKDITSLLSYYNSQHLIYKKIHNRNNISIDFSKDKEELKEELNTRFSLLRDIIDIFQDIFLERKKENSEITHVVFTMYDLYKRYSDLVHTRIIGLAIPCSENDIYNALLFLISLDIAQIKGGIFVYYNGLHIKRLQNNRLMYKRADYLPLERFYKERTRQIHEIDDYAKIMDISYDKAMRYIHDYFSISNSSFLNKYYKSKDSKGILDKPITEEQYKKITENLSPIQKEIVDDKEHQYIIVAAGPGSGKTKVLVHKLASICLQEETRYENILMLTFSRNAAMEFKKRLEELIGKASKYIEISTFHSYAFDLIGRLGSLEESEDIIQKAIQAIDNDEVEISRMTKTVLIIDEAQDMDELSFILVEKLKQNNPDMRIIAVGDDDQNIYSFRDSSSKYMIELSKDSDNSKIYEMVTNFRSKKKIVNLSSFFVSTLKDRLKTEGLKASQDSSGDLFITRHKNRRFQQAVIEDVISRKNEGSTAILVRNNEDALNINYLLKKKGYQTRLIRSLKEDFKAYKLVEMRYFIDNIKTENKSSKCDKQDFRDAYKELKNKYGKSEMFPVVSNIIAQFANSTDSIYINDFYEYLNEIKIEDFYPQDNKAITISTIHQSKGLEYDNVYLSLSYQNDFSFNDEEKRIIYVGLTRAKNNLYVHYNRDVFDNIPSSLCRLKLDSKLYPEAQDIAISLSFRDVFINYFSSIQETILQILPGDKLIFKESGLYIILDQKEYKVIAFSKKFKEKLQSLLDKGYKPVSGKVLYRVLYKKQDEDVSFEILLPEVYLHRDIKKKINIFSN